MTASSIIELADQCVRCGLCLPHCPTYRVGKIEPESPRGRIQLLAAFAEQALEWQPSLQQHLDQCLSCGHCERVCPIPVSYEKLLIQGRASLGAKAPRHRIQHALINLIETPRLRNFFFWGVRVLQKLRIWGALTRLIGQLLPKLGRAMRFIPAVIPARSPVIPAKAGIHFKIFNMDSRFRGNDKGVLLFPGCTGENLGQPTFIAAKKLLADLGFTVYLPPKTWCCGALGAHAGMGLTTTTQTLHAIENFCEKNKIPQVVTFATGCGGFLQKMGETGYPERSVKIIDIQQLLLESFPDSAGASSRLPTPLRVAVHSPCTQTNALRNANLSYDLLKQLPNVELIRFGEKSCCGAAGSYMLEHPKISDQLVAELLTAVLLQNCDVIVTSNIGCQLQFQHYLKVRGIARPVYHPIELLSAKAIRATVG